MRLGADGFVTAALVLVSGTAGAHVITAGAMPLLSRLYKPAEVGLLAVFGGVVATTSVAACLRYDVAVALPEDDQDALGLLILSLSAAAVVSLVLAIVTWGAPASAAAVLRQPVLTPYMWLLPLGVFAAAANIALQAWHIRARTFTILVRARIAQATSVAAVQIGFGLTGFGPVGLVLGLITGTWLAAAVLSPPAVRGLRSMTRDGWRAIGPLARAFRQYPQFSVWEALANTAAIHIPIIMIAAIGEPAEAGYLMWAIYIVQAPMSLIGGAISQVYLSRAPGEAAIGRLGIFTAGVVANLLKAGLGPIIALGILAPTGFELVFGAGWERAGWLVTWMIPWFALQFLVSPISMALHVGGRQRTAMAVQLYGLLLRVGAVWIAARLWSDRLSETYAASGALMYAVYLLVVLRAAGVAGADVRTAIARAVPITAGWLSVAAAVGLVLARLTS